jgi:prepilin-type N-terminal cleavage/methylation domain-containing protein
MRNKSPRSSDGFTLLEVLVSSAVLSILLLILLGAVTTSLSIWRVTEDRMGADREARSAFQMIADDLANAVVPTNPALWPTNASNGTVLRFLTSKPADYQGAADVGDVCFVEYAVIASNNVLLRRFVGSKGTYDALVNSSFPTNSNEPYELLATNIITNTTALKRTAIIRGNNTADMAGVRTNFTRLVLSNGFYTNAAAGQRPDAIQVSIGVADMDSMKNPNLLNNPNILLRGGGFYTFTVNLPSP